MAGVVTGSSVLGLAFEGGVIIAADTLVSYGNMSRFKNCDRMEVVNSQTVVAASGDYADYQYLIKVIKQKQIREKQWNDGLQLYPAALHSWITRVAYNKRSKFEPLYNTWVVGGMQPNEDTGKLEPFLGYVDKLGTAFKSNVITTGFAGQLLATPIFRELTDYIDRLPTEEEARALVTKCMEVVFYRDCLAFSRYKLVVVKADGTIPVVEGPIEIKGNWQSAYKNAI